ncbi:hypothetical protein [Pedobacter deserti]|uniref:hypothetical protein n=1 Tax=Pedobacter deserti TaxID=2817382 RepID=UPI00210E17C6|nr:hypothetical protein [Pedobacter sp. SYSU D00382]
MKHSEFDTAESGLRLDDLIAELSRRLRLYGSFVPYKLEKNELISLLPDKEENLHYFYCLYYAVKGGNSVAFNTNIFELITDISLKNYFSTKTSKITSVGVTTTRLKASISVVRKTIKESKGNYSTIKAATKDGGIDIITYKALDDRGNQLVCLTDATIGKNWKREKKVIVKLSRWKDWIHFKVPPITCLSVVHVIDDVDFHSASRDNGLLFDRPRIMRNFTPEKRLTSTLKNWATTL